MAAFGSVAQCSAVLGLDCKCADAPAVARRHTQSTSSADVARQVNGHEASRRQLENVVSCLGAAAAIPVVGHAGDWIAVGTLHTLPALAKTYPLAQ